MITSSRRTFLKVLAGAGAASLATAPLIRAFASQAGQTGQSDEFFLLIHALGGWDVTLSLDPRWEEKGIVDPASTNNSTVTMLRNWKNAAAPLKDGSYSFRPTVHPSGTPFVFGPAMGNMVNYASRMCVVNGLATNTVSHPDGQTYAVTGRHLNGGRPNQSSIDVCCANEFGVKQMLPVVSVQYPSYLLGAQMDARATPLRISSIGTVAKSLARSTLYDTAAERDNVGMVLSEEAKDLAAISDDPSSVQGFALQYDALRSLLSKNLQNDFNAASLAAAHPEFDIPSLRFQGGAAINAAFALEAFKQNIARCVSFIFNGFDTHFANYTNQALVQQETFDTLAVLLAQLDKIPHPTLAGRKLSEHTHILVTSDFCRTPQINLSGGRDHYPNGSAIIISPKFKGGKLFGSTDAEQLLPANAGTFIDGQRPVAPPDVLATYVSAFGVDSQKYFREGEIIKEILA